MTRVACLMMQKDENILLRPWLLYHGYLFGFENLYVYDNGSSDDTIAALLKEFALLGVNVNTTWNQPVDFQNKGRIIGERIEEFRQGDRYDIALPLDCDEFLAINGADGISCSRTQIHEELTNIFRGGVVCRTAHCLDNRPGYVDLFRYIGHIKSIVLVHSFLGIDHGFHQAGLPPGKAYGTTSLIHIHMHFKPFDQLLRSATEKLAPYVDVTDKEALKAFGGVGNHLTKYFFMDAVSYYNELHGYRRPLVRFGGFCRLISVLMDFDATRDIWESGRPGHLPDDQLEIDLDQTPFRPAGYLKANPELGGDLFDHFLRAGFQEGRRLEVSKEALDEVVERMAAIRAKKRDGVAGYAGCSLGLSRVGRHQEAEDLLRDATKKFGRTLVLLREYALCAMYAGRESDAAQRWGEFRRLFPDDPDGYYYGALSCRRIGEIVEAKRILAEGQSRFPRHIGIGMEVAEIAALQDDWEHAASMWRRLLEEHPDNPDVRKRAASASYQFRLNVAEGASDQKRSALNGPVQVDLRPREAQEALEFLGLSTTAEMREFFMGFESLGCNCEFGLVQRKFGAEPIGLLRWNAIFFAGLKKALLVNFAGIDDPDNLVLELRGGHEYFVQDKKFLTSMHTFTRVGEVEVERFRQQQIKRMSFLKRKIISDLEAGDKIFVYLDHERRSKDDVHQLYNAFKNSSRGTLLYVQTAELPGQVGSVELAEDRLLLGFLERPGLRPDGTWSVMFDNWLKICFAASQIQRALAPC
ncbi:glycosyltransferase family 2 protein [Rhodopila globiformis]|uniref:Uncharacterized protein n=1 Tax=Rhodopila globiformis TaxID=1071 RepID=A0A2S6N1U0_RHOGL|nr:glycosyltransferase family 2 protein [Rhodopila globiformis]PPQ28585.1 hypothetical protein CCS01_24090 [Rhodopila globiformis]